MWVPFLRSFLGNEAHQIFWGGPQWGVLVGAKKFMLKKFMCFFRPLEMGVDTGQQLNANFLLSNFSGTSGTSWQKSRYIPPKCVFSLDFDGHTELFSRGRPPPHRPMSVPKI